MYIHVGEFSKGEMSTHKNKGPMARALGTPLELRVIYYLISFMRARTFSATLAGSGA